MCVELLTCLIEHRTWQAVTDTRQHTLLLSRNIFTDSFNNGRHSSRDWQLNTTVYFLSDAAIPIDIKNTLHTNILCSQNNKGGDRHPVHGQKEDEM